MSIEAAKNSSALVYPSTEKPHQFNSTFCFSYSRFILIYHEQVWSRRNDAESSKDVEITCFVFSLLALGTPTSNSTVRPSGNWKNSWNFATPFLLHLICYRIWILPAKYSSSYHQTREQNISEGQHVQGSLSIHREALSSTYFKVVSKKNHAASARGIKWKCHVTEVYTKWTAT